MDAPRAVPSHLTSYINLAHVGAYGELQPRIDRAAPMPGRPGCLLKPIGAGRAARALSGGDFDGDE